MNIEKDSLEQFERQYVIGTAGHIDHGKTALVHALTGINTDRLKEEKERGITIDLGFAHFSSNITIIDVPGHERLIKNMVAGVSTIDLVLFVVAVDDGIMPQTREHLDIINLLGIHHGIFILTKCDLVDQEWINLIEEEVRELLKGTPLEKAPILPSSASTSMGIETIRSTILNYLKKIPPKENDGIFRMPIDRVFSKAGFGTVVTGSVLSGKLSINEFVEILPQKLQVRVRGLQSHDLKVNQVKAGYRAAVNLTHVAQNELHRGEVITSPGYYQPVMLFNAKMQVLQTAPLPLKNQMRLRLHLHTSEVLARVVIPGTKIIHPGESNFVQMRLEKPIYASYRDTFVIRQYSPQITLGGGVILETNPQKFRKKYQDIFYKTSLAFYEGSSEKRFFASFSTIEIQPLTAKEIQIKCGLSKSEADLLINKNEQDQHLLSTLKGSEKLFFSTKQLELVLIHIEENLKIFHQKNPERSGKRLSEVISQVGKKFPENLIQLAVNLGVKQNRITISGDLGALANFERNLDTTLLEKIKNLEELYQQAGFNPPNVKDACDKLNITKKDFAIPFSILQEQGKLIFVEEQIFFHRDSVERSLNLLRKYFENQTSLRVSEFKELIQTTRKFALPLLNYFDKKNYTERQGETRTRGKNL